MQFNGLTLTKVYNVSAKKGTEELCLIALKIDTKIDGKLACVSKNWHEEFGTRALESLQNGTLMASFCLKLKMYELKINRGIMCHDNEE